MSGGIGKRTEEQAEVRHTYLVVLYKVQILTSFKK